VCGVDVVIHLAFIIPKMSATHIESELRPDWAEAVNVGGTRNLLEALRAQPIRPRLVFTSSLHVYGRTHDLPPPRTVDEPVHPVEHYARHKVKCEEMIRASGLQWAIFRLAATLPLALHLDPGIFDVPLVNRMEFVHTRDVGLALANAVTSAEIWGKTLLIGGGPHCQYIYGDMVARILGAMGVGTLPREAFATVPFATDWLDTAESQRLLHYQSRTLDTYIQDLHCLLGPRLPMIRLFRPAVRRSLLARSPHWARHMARRRVGWSGKTALVTGASSGIGAAVARQLARQGVHVLLVARRAERLELLADEIRRDGGQADVLPADLADERARFDLLEQARRMAGDIDILVNSAGFGWYGYGSEMPWPVAWEMMQTNMTAVAHLTLLVLRHMRARGTGHIVNIGSIAGSLPEQGIALYSATKSFVDSFSTALHRELRGSRVHVSVLRAGPVHTEFYAQAADRPAGRGIPGERLAITPERVARTIMAVLSRPRRVAYVPGWLRVVPWVEPTFGWLIDWLGPALLRR